MDDKRFDALTKTLSTPGTRRGVVRLIAALPFTGSLAAVLDPTEAGAKKPVDRVRARAARKQTKRQNRKRGKGKGGSKKSGGKGKGKDEVKGLR